jgi:hypothetical protein
MPVGGILAKLDDHVPLTGASISLLTSLGKISFFNPCSAFRFSGNDKNRQNISAASGRYRFRF